MTDREAWQKCYGSIINALADIVWQSVDETKHRESIERPECMKSVMRIRAAVDEYGAALAQRTEPAKHEHERGAPLTDDCDNWCRAKADAYIRPPVQQPDHVRIETDGSNVGPKMTAYYTEPQQQVEPVAWRWRPKGSLLWIYDPTTAWLETQGDTIDKEPLYAAPPAVQQQVEPVANLHDNKTDVTEAHPMLSATHFCRDCRALWRQCDDFSMNLRSSQCCDKCDNTPVADQLIPLYAAPPAVQQQVEPDHKEWCSLRRPEYCGECDCDAAPPAVQVEPTQTNKEAWWAGYRAGAGLPADTPRQDAVQQLARLTGERDEAVRLLREAFQYMDCTSEASRICMVAIHAYLAKVTK